MQRVWPCLASAAGKAPRTTVPQTAQALQEGQQRVPCSTAPKTGLLVAEGVQCLSRCLRVLIPVDLSIVPEEFLGFGSLTVLFPPLYLAHRLPLIFQWWDRTYTK
jgi:hypothetical protein